MAETAPVTPAAPAPTQAAPGSGDQSKSASTVPSVQPLASDPQSQPQPDKAVEQRSAMLAQAKRLAAKAQAEREAVKQERASFAAFQEKAQRYDALDKLRTEDPLKFAQDLELDVPGLAKKWLEKSSGQGVSPAELVKQEVAKTLAEQRAADQAAWQKHQAEQDRQVLEGTKAQFTRIVQAEPTKYELCARQNKAEVAERALFALSQEYGKSQRVLPLGEALAAVEYAYKAEALERLGDEVKDGTPTAEVNARWEELKGMTKKQREAKQAAADAEKAKAAADPKIRVTDAPRSVVETSKQQSPTQTRRARVPDYQRIAAELMQSIKARSDN